MAIKELIQITLLSFFLIAAPAPAAAETNVDTRPAVIASMLESYKPWYEDVNEEPVARKARLLMLATAQVHAVDLMMCSGQYDTEECIKKFEADPRQLYALLLTAGWWETRYNSRIHAGRCNKDECDGGKARGVYQAHANGTYPKEIWNASQGDDWEGTLAATQAAAYSFSSAWKGCKNRAGIQGVWCAYGRGRCHKSYPGAIHRMHWSIREYKKLKGLMPMAGDH